MLADARAGRARRQVLLGQAGVGKTTLCGCASDLAQAYGMRVLWAQGVEWESMLPFASLSELLRPLRALIGTLPEVQQAALDGLFHGTANNDDFLGLGAAALGLLAAAGEDQPTLVVLDDAHWVDEPSVRALAFAAKRLLTDRIALLVAGRSVPALLSDWPERELTGLDDGDARHVALQVDNRLSNTVLDELIEQTHGNPLALTETVRQLTQEQRDGRAALPDPLPLGEQGRSSFGNVLRGLPEPTRLALSVLAAAGPRSGAAFSDALATMGINPDELVPAEHAGVVVTSDRGPQFRHPLLRSAALAETPPDQLRAVDLALADIYAAGDPERRAWHLGRAIPGASEQVALAWERAAAAIEPHFGASATADALERAALTSPLNDRRPQRFLVAARACFEAGRLDRCAALLDELGPQENPNIRAESLLMRGDMSRWIGSSAAPLDALAALANSTQPPSAEHATIAGLQMIVIAQNSGDLASARHFGERALISAKAAGGAWPNTVKIHGARNGILLGDRSQVAELLRDDGALRSITQDRSPEWASFGSAAAQAIYWCGHFERARSLLDELIDSARVRGAASLLPYPLGVAAEAHWWLGDWALALSLVEESATLGHLTGQRVLVAFTLAMEARIAAGMGLRDRARRAANEAGVIASDTGARPAQIYASYALGLDQLSAGDPLAALEPLEAAHRLRRRLGGMQGESVVPYRGDLAEALALTGRTDEAREHADSLALAGEREESPWAAGVALRVQGLIAEDDYEGYLADALKVLPDVPVSFDRARTYLVLGARLRRDRRLREAREPLGEAAKLFIRLGATPWLDRTRHLLRLVGGDTVATSADPLGLTGQELQVCQAVAAGATNREVAAALFLSPKTVEHHLTRVYAKLGVRSRSQLSKLAHEGGLGLPV